MKESTSEKILRNFEKIEACIDSIQNESQYEAIQIMIDTFVLRFNDHSNSKGMTLVLRHKFKKKRNGIEGC